jgi:hypothetical protein
MKEYRRPHYSNLKSRLAEKRNFIQVIAGPRQVGKTTLIRQLLENRVDSSSYVSADSYEGSGSNWIEKHWEAARILSRQRNASHILAIDEIQRIPDWSTTVKKLWDEDTFSGSELKVIISGSSNLLIAEGLTESLAGRYEITTLSHWSLAEMHEAFGWSAEQYTWFGGYPGSAILVGNEQRWKQYVRDSLIEPTIAKDILMMTRIDKPVLLRQLFNLGCSYSGQILSYNKMLGQLQDAGNTVTLAGYLNLLDSAGLLTGIEKYSGSTVRQKLSSPKLMVRNTALLSSSFQEGFEQIRNRPELWGRVVESAIGAHLVNRCRENDCRVWYWREGNDEVDFIIQNRNVIAAVEIKSGPTIRKKGFDRFRKLYPDSKTILVGDAGIPWQEFLLMEPQDIVS